MIDLPPKSFLQAVIHLKSLSDLTLCRGELSGKIGFVPTMGALHEGHLSLIKKSKAENEATICSIFVNPLQFNNPEDFEKYPQVLEKDVSLLEKVGCDVLFSPSATEMYPSIPKLTFHFGHLEQVMEGAFRPGHFNGVAIVVSKLFHLVQPSVAYFGQKDLQQTLVIKQLVKDLQFPLSIVVCDTQREPDGLALSSRNVRLDPIQREKASILYRALLLVKDKIGKGESIASVLEAAKFLVASEPAVRLEYLEILEVESLLPISDSFRGNVAVCIAAYFGNVRLIDNIVMAWS
jgi:pantoate--beta-alanine ligase